MYYNLLVILGPTASGKTKLGVQLAEILNGEIISADSRQVYRGMDIGTGKDLVEYGSIPYHLIDIVDPGFEFNVFRFQGLFVKAFETISKRDCLPILVGGTGMYLDSALMGYRLQEVPRNAELRAELEGLSMEDLILRIRNIRPRQHNNTDLVDRDRLIRAIEIAEYEIKIPSRPLPEIKPLVFGIRWERETLRRRITERLKYRLSNGMIVEAEKLHRNGTSFETLEFYGLEYRFLARFLKGELNRNDMFQKLNSAIHDFAKRQETWFRRMERNGIKINWLNGAGDPFAEALNILNSPEKTFNQQKSVNPANA
jgi:tRNA dimethylallyltransferase